MLLVGKFLVDRSSLEEAQALFEEAVALVRV